MINASGGGVDGADVGVGRVVGLANRASVDEGVVSTSHVLVT